MVLNSLANFRSLQIHLLKSAINQTKERDAHKSFAHHKITSNKSITLLHKKDIIYLDLICQQISFQHKNLQRLIVTHPVGA